MATFEPKITRIEPLVAVQSKIKAARAFLKEGRRDEALAELETALQLDPNSKLAHLGAGTLKGRQRDFDGAIRHFKEVLRVDPLNLQAPLRLALVHIAKRELDKAQEQFESALRLDPKSQVAYLGLGFIATRRNEFAKAKEYLETVLRLNPRFVRARTQIAVVHRLEGNRKEALAQLNAAIRIEPNKPEVYEALGRLHLAEKDFGEARQAFEYANTLGSKSNAASIGLAEALVAESQLDRAEEVLRGMPSRTDQKPAVHKVWADLYFSRGLYREAAEEYGAAGALADPEDSVAPPSTESLPDAEDHEGWRKYVLTLKERTDVFRDKQRDNIDIVEADETD